MDSTPNSSELTELSKSESVLNWDRQIKLFAQYFLANITLPQQGGIRILDVGCGTGTALSEIRRIRETAQLFGCDLDPLHVELARHMNSPEIQFFQSDIMSITGGYDVTYVSNVFEHIQNWRESILHLCSISHTVFIMVPFEEDLTKIRRSGIEHVDHINTYNRESFSFLSSYGYTVQSRVIRTPNAWGHLLHREFKQKLNHLLQGQQYRIPREILFMVHTQHNPSSSKNIPRFRNPFSAKFRSIVVALRSGV